MGPLDASRDPATISSYHPSGVRALLGLAEPLPGTIRIIHPIDRPSGNPRSSARHGISEILPKTPPLAGRHSLHGSVRMAACGRGAV
jgi:hypothetical protein